MEGNDSVLNMKASHGDSALNREGNGLMSLSHVEEKARKI